MKYGIFANPKHFYGILLFSAVNHIAIGCRRYASFISIVACLIVGTSSEDLRDRITEVQIGGGVLVPMGKRFPRSATFSCVIFLRSWLSCFCLTKQASCGDVFCV